MEQFLTAPFWVALSEIIVINVLLSGDNAVVIALACRHLPARQRSLGVFWGALGAIVLRIVLTYFAVMLLRLPYVKLVGAILLIWIGIKLLIEEEEATGVQVKSGHRLWDAVRTIVIADVIMSLDNVIGVAAAAKDSLLLLILGLTISIPLIVWGSQIILKLIDRYPVLIVAGGGLLGYVAGEMAIVDPLLEPFAGTQPALRYGIPIACIALVVFAGKWLTARQLARSQTKGRAK